VFEVKIAAKRRMLTADDAGNARFALLNGRRIGRRRAGFAPNRRI